VMSDNGLLNLWAAKSKPELELGLVWTER